MRVKEESEKVGLKLNIQKTKIMASGPIISWQIDGKKIERKAMANLDNILKSRDITLPTKVCIVKAMVFPIVRNGCESWTIKNAECQRINAFQTVVLGKALEIPLDCKEIKPVNPKGNQP